MQNLVVWVTYHIPSAGNQLTGSASRSRRYTAYGSCVSASVDTLAPTGNWARRAAASDGLTPCTRTPRGWGLPSGYPPQACWYTRAQLSPSTFAISAASQPRALRPAATFGNWSMRSKPSA